MAAECDAAACDAAVAAECDAAACDAAAPAAARNRNVEDEEEEEEEEAAGQSAHVTCLCNPERGPGSPCRKQRSTCRQCAATGFP